MHLSRRTVVQCSNLSDTLFQDGNKTMTSLPTLIVLADPTPQYATDADAMATLAHTLCVGLESGLPMVLVAPPAAAAYARSVLPSNDIVELADTNSLLSRTDTMAKAVSAGVLASPHAPGWLLWPADMSDVQADTLRLMARSVGTYPMVFPQYCQRRGHPVGLSAEFFSELIRLNTERDLGRLMTRYPALGIDVNDPGILESDLPQASLGQLRTQLQGVPVGAPSAAAMALV
jgi:molybdenum cofactor cytidylyltransferase